MMVFYFLGYDLYRGNQLCIDLCQYWCELRRIVMYNLRFVIENNICIFNVLILVQKVLVMYSLCIDFVSRELIMYSERILCRQL